jgi:N-acetylgalactosamine-N,N'-diacetylbacillosaminyl-diphospho-undecaprenol 4-alpha-N-acetylgalactosaminyltransferase
MKGVRPKMLISINTLESAGAERVVSLLLQHLKNEFEIHLALYTKIIEYEIPAEIKILDLKQPLKQNKLLRFLKMPAQSFKVYRYCKKNGINISVAFLYRSCYINAFMKSLWNYKGRVIMCERIHQTTMQESHSAIYRAFSKIMIMFSYERADMVLANSYAMKMDLIENFKIKTPIKVIYNPIDLNYIDAQINAPMPIVFEEGIFYFISVGGFRKEKNHLLLLKAFFTMKDLPCKLIIVGGGSMENELKQKAVDYEIADKVIFCGWDINPFKYVSHSNCFVLSSDVEGFPNVLIEALACRKAIISTDSHCGPRELLAPSTDWHYRAINNYEIAEYGVLIPVNDVIELAAAMKRMYDDGALRKNFEEKARARAQQFDVTEIKEYFKAAFTAL